MEKKEEIQNRKKSMFLQAMKNVQKKQEEELEKRSQQNQNPSNE